MYHKVITAITVKNKHLQPLIIYLITLFACFITAQLLSETLWQRKLALVHTSIELLCIFVALSSFLIVWFTDNANTRNIKILGYGFLSVAIYDIFHTYYFQALNLYPEGFFDLNARYWIIGRFTESLVVFFCTSNIIKVKYSRLKWLLIALTIPAMTALAILYFPKLMPTLITTEGMTFPKIMMEYIIIFISFVSLYFLRKKVNRRGMITYKYLLISVLLNISAGFCFTLYSTIPSFFNAFGHTLKLASYFFLLNGVFASAVTYPYEITKRSKQKLLDTKSELREILNGLPLAIIKYENSERISFANKKALEILECRSNDLVGLTPKELDKKFCSSNNDILSEMEISSGDVLNSLREYTTLTGNPIKANVSAVRYCQGILVSFSDIKNELELDNLRIQTRTILNSITNLVLLTDTNYKIIMLNNAFSDCVEMESDEIIGMSLNELNRKIQFSVDNKPYNINLASLESGNSYEATFVTPTGNRKYLIFNSSPVMSYDNKLIGYIGVSSDITEFKKEQNKLLQQEKLALIGQMGSGIVHETKNHLASIKGYCQLLSMKVTDENLKCYIDRIEDITADVNKVIVDFLSMAKPAEILMDITSLNEIIESVRYMVESPSFMKGVNIEISLCEHDEDINVDESLIKQVILNLTKNAIEAMNDVENPRLIISTDLNTSTDHALLIISDNGKGISEENLKKLGTPFFTTKENGTGLGLSMCYKIINEHGGNIRVTSELGKGTSFIISIPLYKNNI